jgi:hypothetical protein
MTKATLERHKELESLLKKMRTGYSVRDNFAILMEIMAITLANVRTDIWQEREGMYLKLIKTVDAEATMRASAFVMEWFASEPTPMDLLGPFHTWIGMDNSGSGQFFTPWEVAVMMARMSLESKECIEAQIEEKGYVTICDPTCGAGGTLLAAANALHGMGIDCRNVVFYGQELMPTTAYTCFVQCALSGLPAVIGHGNTLKMDTFQTFATLPYWELRLKLTEENMGAIA